MFNRFCVRVFDMDVSRGVVVIVFEEDACTVLEVEEFVVATTVVDGVDSVVGVLLIELSFVEAVVVDVIVTGVRPSTLARVSPVELSSFCCCCTLAGITRSTPGTMAAGTGGGAGSGDVGSRVGKRGTLTSGSFVYRFSRGESIFISLSFERNVSTHSCIISLDVFMESKRKNMNNIY